MVLDSVQLRRHRATGWVLGPAGFDQLRHGFWNPVTMAHVLDRRGALADGHEANDVSDGRSGATSFTIDGSPGQRLAPQFEKHNPEGVNVTFARFLVT